MSERRRSRSNDRGLWSAVVLQAIADIESQPTQSATFCRGGSILHPAGRVGRRANDDWRFPGFASRRFGGEW